MHHCEHNRKDDIAWQDYTQKDEIRRPAQRLLYRFLCYDSWSSYTEYFMKIFLNSIHGHEVTKARRKIIIKKIYCDFCLPRRSGRSYWGVSVAKTPIRSKFARHSFSDSGTIFVTKTDYFCHKAMDNLETLFVKTIYKLKYIYINYLNNRLFFQPISHDTLSNRLNSENGQPQLNSLSHNRHIFCSKIAQSF